MQTAENALLPAFGVMFVRLYHTSESPYPVWMALFCFFSGILLGTVWVNRMGASLKEEITGLAPLYWSVHNVKSSVSAVLNMNRSLLAVWNALSQIIICIMERNIRRRSLPIIIR